ncbi:hypothetical protein [Lactiplantibacillus plantarum]|uniref:hypothetical protein n=1 Tax=Lactiplantibacillus plantarum TaxID=1590 RepID=UPI001E33584B|nr:hypothetical protein [Lactiplantibacillus plantarum]
MAVVIFSFIAQKLEEYSIKKWSTYNKNTSHKIVELSSIVVMSSVLGIILAKPVQGKADQTSSPSTTKVKAATSGATSEVSSISTITANSATNVSSAIHQFSTATTTSQQASSTTSNISTTTASKQISKSTTGKLNSNETATTSNSAATSVAVRHHI